VFSDPGGELFHVDKLDRMTIEQQDNREGVETYDGVVTLAKGQSIYFASGKGVNVGGGDHVDLRATVKLAGVAGDFNGNGTLDAEDIDLLSADVRSGLNTPKFDVTGDKLVNQGDRETWVNSLRKTYFGDSNLDGEFSSADFVSVFTAGQYEDAVAGNSTWATGDWNGDGDFTSSDFVSAFQAGGYEKGPRAAVGSVPEPISVTLLLVGGIVVAFRCRRLLGAAQQ
jgi:hypothetical protein